MKAMSREGMAGPRRPAAQGNKEPELAAAATDLATSASDGGGTRDACSSSNSERRARGRPDDGSCLEAGASWEDRAMTWSGACGGQVVDAGRTVDECRLGRQPLAAVGGVWAVSGAAAPCARTAGAGGVRRAARSTPMTAPMSHAAKATDAMPPLQKPVRDSPATA